MVPLRSQCDVLVVSLRGGLLHVTVEIAMHDQQVAHAALDAGADVILGHHAHILKGTEFYGGKPIFYGLCKIVFDMLPSRSNSEASRAWGKKRMAVFGFEDDPEYPNYRFHPDAKMTIVAKLIPGLGRGKQPHYLRRIPDVLQVSNHVDGPV